MDKVSVVLATYKPDLDYLGKQLASLNEQDYQNLDLLVCDDSNDETHFENVKKEIESRITNFHYTLIHNETNLGSNQTFGKLTSLATGKYIAYCDQDDIWEKEKITKLIKAIKEQEAVISYSDLAIINDSDELVASSLKKITKRLNHVYGDKKYTYFLRRNSVTGCTMLINSNVAKESLPFPNYEEYVHDHWLAIYASCKGKVAYVEEPLIKYRIHSNNQIGAKVLVGIENKTTYLQKKILVEKRKVNFVKQRNLSSGNDEIEQEIKRFDNFVSKRINFFEKKSFKNIVLFLMEIRFDPLLIAFEFLISILPDSLSCKLINKAKS